jgi:general secretion pathway protein G
MNQRGFATLEVILMVMVIGILASIAVPRFTDITTKANTAKIQADLSTIDTAIQIYIMEKGSEPTNVSDLNEYLNDAANLKPPTGKAFINGTATNISEKIYAVKKTTTTGEGESAVTTTETRATLDNHTLADFTK